MEARNHNSQNLAIAVLSITAVILFVGLVVVNVQPAPVAASDISVSGGDFTVSVGRVSRDTDGLYVIDNVSQRLLVYGINRQSGAINVLDKAELAPLTPPIGR